MAKNAKTPPHEATDGDSAKPPSADRRRWLKAGLSASPVLMTVVSRPVLAQTCVPPSAYVSLGASAPGMYVGCGGNGPGTWLNSTDDWPRGYEPSQPFKKYFPSDFVGNPSLSDILGTVDIGVSDVNLRQVARYVIAALLNNASEKVPETVLRAMTIQHIWTEYATRGFFAPTSGTSWSAAEIVNYLQSTMIFP